MAARRIVAVAPAKVNLYLSVGGRREDGYHEVSNIMTAISLADEVAITYTPCGGKGAADDASQPHITLTCEPEVEFPLQDNLAYRAIEAYARRLGRPAVEEGGALEIHIDKLIPMKAGLGGGSADAAAAIVACAALWGENPLSDACLGAAADIGSDVPFFLYGGCALMGGRGEKLVERIPSKRLHLVVLNSGGGSETAGAYRLLDEHPRPLGSHETLIGALGTGDARVVGACVDNSFDDAIARSDMEIARRLEWLRHQRGVLGAVLSGSGSSCFGVCESAEDAEFVGLAASCEGFWACACETVPSGAQVISDEGV